MSDERLLKTSIFVHSTGRELINDLTEKFYPYDAVEVELLKELSDTPRSLETLESLRPELAPQLRRLTEEGLLVPASLDETGHFVAHRIDIETCRQCNARCKFCPQSISPKPRGVMPLDLFELILDKVEPRPPQWVALNHYGEPLLDPHFRERVLALRDRRFPLNLFTNGTLLKESLADFLCEGELYGVTFNFPSLEVSEWCELMHLSESGYWNARRGIEHFLSARDASATPATISVNAHTGDEGERVERLSDHFSTFGPVHIQWEDSNSRAGAIENPLVRIVSHGTENYFGGCERFAGHLHVSWEGKVFLCCQDYDQRVVLGDLREASIDAIMSSESARQLRAEMFGLSAMSAGRICRNCTKLRKHRFLPAGENEEHRTT